MCPGNLACQITVASTIEEICDYQIGDQTGKKAAGMYRKPPEKLRKLALFLQKTEKEDRRGPYDIGNSQYLVASEYNAHQKNRQNGTIPFSTRLLCEQIRQKKSGRDKHIGAHDLGALAYEIHMCGQKRGEKEGCAEQEQRETGTG